MVEKKLEISNEDRLMGEDCYSFSICTLVKNQENYNILRKSLKKNGFANNSDEILSIDNTKNADDCYSAIKKFISVSKNRYLILTHDDVIINLDRSLLVSGLKKICSYDSNAAVFGVAGIYNNPLLGSGHFIGHKGEENWGFNHHGRVKSLDECFFIIDKKSGISVSDDLSGFHFYGTDICINATKKGFSCYVLDYPITHTSKGNLDQSFINARRSFINHLKKIKKYELVTTTCTSMYAGNHFFTKIKSLSLAIAKPILGENDKCTFVKNTILDDLENANLMKLIVISYLEIIIWNHKLYTFYTEIIYPNTKYLRKLYTDIIWWKKNWRSRFCF